MQADLVIKNAMVLTMDEKLTVYEKADLAIKDAKIVDLCSQTKFQAPKTIEAQGKLVMPGLINTHTHAAMVMMRGLADDMPLDLWWKNFIFPIEKKLLDPEFVKIGVALAAIEMIKSGTTSFSDMYFFEDAAAEVCKKIGMRAFLGEGVLDFPSPDAQSADETFKIIERLHEKWGKDPIIHLEVAPHASYSCGPENLLKARKLAERLGLPLHIHVAETATEVAEIKLKYGASPVEHLEKIGFLFERVKAVHCVHLSHRDIEILKRRGVKVAHCQESNMKLASGQAPVVELLDEGISVGLGTDGAASNNNLNMFEEMDTVAKFHKAVRSDPTVMDAKTVLKLATSEAAKVVFKEKEIGSLEVGKTADLIILNLNLPHLVPLYNIYSHLVYSAGGAEVETVIINGKLIMDKRKVLTVNEDEIMDQAKHLAKKIQAEVGNG